MEPGRLETPPAVIFASGLICPYNDPIEDRSNSLLNKEGIWMVSVEHILDDHPLEKIAGWVARAVCKAKRTCFPIFHFPVIRVQNVKQHGG